MSYDYEKYDGKRYVVDGEIIGLFAMEYGHEVESVFDEFHAEVALTPEQERQVEAYYENLRTALSAQYKIVDGLQAENAKLLELISSYWRRTHMPIAPNVERVYLSEMRELGVEVDE